MSTNSITKSNQLNLAFLDAGRTGRDSPILRAIESNANPDKDTLFFACLTNKPILVDKAISLGAQPSPSTFQAAEITGNEEIISKVTQIATQSLPERNGAAAAASTGPSISLTEEMCVRKVPEGTQTRSGFYLRPRKNNERRLSLIIHSDQGVRELRSMDWNKMTFEFVLGDNGEVQIEYKHPEEKEYTFDTSKYGGNLKNILDYLSRGNITFNGDSYETTQKEGGHTVYLYRENERPYSSQARDIGQKAKGVALKTFSDLKSSLSPTKLGNTAASAGSCALSGAIAAAGLTSTPTGQACVRIMRVLGGPTGGLVADSLESLRLFSPMGMSSHKWEPETAMADFFEAYKRRNEGRLLRNQPNFLYQNQQIRTSSSLPQMLSTGAEGTRFNLTPEQQKEAIEGCRAAYDYELKSRGIDRVLQDETLQRWTPIQGAYDTALVWKYSKDKKQLTIACRGSVKGKEDHTKDPDWRRNLTCVPYDPKLFGINLEGKIHAGFLKKYSECQSNFYVEMAKFFSELPKEELNDLQIIVTGHSLGAAVSQILAADLCTNVLPQIYTPDSLTNRVWTLPLSAPCVGDQVALDKIHGVIGMNNCLRVNVDKDPVTIAGTGAIVRKLRSSKTDGWIPLTALNPLLECCIFQPFGHLALHPSIDAMAGGLSGDVILKVYERIKDKDYNAAAKTGIMALFAPVHGGGSEPSGRIGFDSELFANMNLAASIKPQPNSIQEERTA